MVKCDEFGSFMHVARSKSRTGKKYLYFRCGNPECTRKQKNIRAQVVLDALYKTLDSLHFTKRDAAKIQNSLTDYINVRHTNLLRKNSASMPPLKPRSAVRTNQLDSIGEKMESADSWQKDQLAQNMLTNLEINNKNEVSFRWKKPLKHIFNNASAEEFRSGARNRT